MHEGCMFMTESLPKAPAPSAIGRVRISTKDNVWWGDTNIQPITEAATYIHLTFRVATCGHATTQDHNEVWPSAILKVTRASAVPAGTLV